MRARSKSQKVASILLLSRSHTKQPTDGGWGVEAARREAARLKRQIDVGGDPLNDLKKERHLDRLVLPSGVVDFKTNTPASDVNLVATGTSVVVRENLHPQLIYLLAQALQEEHGKAGIFQKAGEFPTQTDPEFSVAEEARDFYRNGPPLLQKYLPYWQITLAQRAAAIVLAVIAVAIPMLAAIPRLYQWFQQIDLRRLYRRLRALEAELTRELSTPQIEALQGSLETIDREAKSLPMRHSAPFFDLLMHIDLMRARLAARLASLRNSPIQSDDRPRL